MAVDVERPGRPGFWPSFCDGIGLGPMWRRLFRTAENRAMAELDRTLHMMGDLVAENELLRRELDAAVATERERCLYWSEIGDSDGYAEHQIREGVPIPRGPNAEVTGAAK